MLFIVGRMLHAFSLLKHERYDGSKIVGSLKFRVVGMVLSFGCIGGLALVLLVKQF